jgi:hypothetical protein
MPLYVVLKAMAQTKQQQMCSVYHLELLYNYCTVYDMLWPPQCPLIGWLPRNTVKKCIQSNVYFLIVHKGV